MTSVSIEDTGRNIIQTARDFVAGAVDPNARQAVLDGLDALLAVIDSQIAGTYIPPEQLALPVGEDDAKQDA